MTFSIIARDPATRCLAVAAQSCYLAVGAAVPWIRPGVGAVATQARAEPGYGPALLEQVGNGIDPSVALAEALASDEAAAQRQVAVLSASGATAVHSGSQCIPIVEQHVGENYVALGNLLGVEGTVAAMGAAFESTVGDLASRLLAALVAGQDHGGDLRGTQSAAMLLATDDKTYPSIDLRVDDHSEPLSELTRLLDLHSSYRLLGDGVKALMSGRPEEAASILAEARKRQPDNKEFAFWADVSTGSSPAQLGERWAELERRLLAIGQLTS